MGRFELFSIRNRVNKTEPEVYTYDEFPVSFRNQFFHIVSGVIEHMGSEARTGYRTSVLWEMICKDYAQEKGLKYLSGRNGCSNDRRSFETYVDNASNEDFLDLMDYIFVLIVSNERFHKVIGIHKETAFQEAIGELNWRLKQHSLGYEFINGEIIKKTNAVTHETVIKPALKLLCDEDFRGAEEEYLTAWNDYKQGDYKNAVVNAAKAFESTMKTICEKMEYPYDKERDESKKLLGHLKDNGFYPSYLDSHMNGIRITLESGAPTVRNRTSGHGQGSEVQNLSEEYVVYVLNLVATNIVFLYGIYKRHKR